MSQDLPLPSKIEIDVTLSQIYDSKEPDAPDVNTYGYLYKLAGNNSLWWRSIAGITNLSNPTISSLSSFGTATSLFGDTVTVVAPSNTKAGIDALDALGDGLEGGGNTAFGASALSLLPDDSTQGIFTAFGYQAGMNLQAGFGSIFFGFQSGVSLEGSNNDIGIGYRTFGRSTNTSGNNIGIGNQTFYSATFSGDSNITIGNQSLIDLTTGEQNIVIGKQAGYTMTTGSYNILLGDSCGFNILDGSNNIAIGVDSLKGVIEATENVCVGTESLPTANGTGNTSMGNASGYGLTTGTYNSIFGNYAGFNLITGSFNCIIGASATTDINHSNCIVIGPNSISSASAQIRLGFDASFNPVQTTCFIDGIRGKTTVQNDAVAVLVDSKGQLGTISSSMRYKENIHDISDNVIDSLFKMRPTSFNYKEYPDSSTFGLIAEEVNEILPQIVVYKDIDGESVPDTIKYHLLVPLLVGAVKKLNNRCDELQKIILA